MSQVQEVDYVWLKLGACEAQEANVGEYPFGISGELWNDSDHPVVLERIRVESAHPEVYELMTDAGVAEERLGPKQLAPAQCENIHFDRRLRLRRKKLTQSEPPQLKLWAEFRFDGNTYRSAPVILGPGK